MFRHEIPTHLGVQDRLMLGLSARQLLLVLAGLTAAHAVWSRLGALAWLPGSARAAIACAVAALFVAAALVRPHGRGVDEWAFAVARYAALPRLSVWRADLPAPHGPRFTACPDDGPLGPPPSDGSAPGTAVPGPGGRRGGRP